MIVLTKPYSPPPPLTTTARAQLLKVQSPPSAIFLPAAKPTGQGEGSRPLLVVVVGGLFPNFPCRVKKGFAHEGELVFFKMGASSSFLSITEYPLRRTLKGSLSCSSIKRCEVMCFFQKSANACFITESWTVGWRSTSSWCCRFAEKGVPPEYSRRPSLALLCWTTNCPLTTSHPLKI